MGLMSSTYYDPNAYLETEARIIAENDTHAVIAIRVEKATIARNLPFIGALVDLTGRLPRKVRAR